MLHDRDPQASYSKGAFTSRTCCLKHSPFCNIWREIRRFSTYFKTSFLLLYNFLPSFEQNYITSESYDPKLYLFVYILL